jgi:hypothetical protein
MNQRMWGPADVTRLLAHIKKKKSLEDISKQERRSLPSVKAKLKEIAVDLYFNKNMEYSKVEEITGIQKSALVVKRTRVEIPERSGSPKNSEELSKEAVAVTTVPEIIQATPEYKIRLSTENPFSISSLSDLINSTIEICLLSRDC